MAPSTLRRLPLRPPRSIALAATLVVLATLGAAADEHVASACETLRAENWRDASGVADPQGDVRVYAIQYKHEIRHVRTHAAFETKMRCLIEELVLPTADADGDGRADGTTIVVLNEDAGLATIAAGSRGLPARAFATSGPKDPQSIPGAQGSFATLAITHAPGIAYYATRHPDTSAQRLILAAATDGFVRGFMATNARLAREYGIYLVSSNNQAEFRETTDPVAIATLADPDGPLPPPSVFEAVDVGPDPSDPPEATGEGRDGIDVYNQAFMWAPVDAPEGHPVRARYEAINGAPLSEQDPRRNIVHVVRKTPLTSIEREILTLSDDRDMTVGNTGPFCLLEEWQPGLPQNGCAEATIRIGYGISLPAFKWGSHFEHPAPVDVEPCTTPELWMRCLDARGINLFLQPEANPGMWTEYIDAGWDPHAFQALSWLDSAWRAVADPTVQNIRYAVTAHLVGNLVDLTFDGQSVIFERCLPRDGGDTCEENTPRTFAGARDLIECAPGATRCDDPLLAPYAGLLRQTIAMAPWVLDDDPALGPEENRERLAERARAMQAGTRSPYENDYLETAVWADLAFDEP